MAFLSRPASLDYATELLGYATEFQALRADDSERLRHTAEYRSECVATRGTNLDVHIGETDYGRKPRGTAVNERTRMQLPLGQALTVKGSDRIAGRLPDVLVARRGETEEERYRSRTIENIWHAITCASNGETQFSDAAWDASQVGSAPFSVYYDIEKQMPIYRAYDPASCLVVRGLSDPHDFQRVYRFWEAPTVSVQNDYRGKSFRGVPIPVDRIAGSGPTTVTQKSLIVQMCGKDHSIRFVLDGSLKSATHIALEEEKHDYGFVPHIVIPNIGPYRDVFGWADYEFTREIIRYISVMFGREADILKLVANGAMTVKGAKQSPEVIKAILATGGVIPIGREGELSPVQVPEVPQFAQGHSDRAIDFLERLGFAPPASWGSGTAGSGSDRGLQLQPQIELTRHKQKNWSAGLQRLAEYAFRMVTTHQTRDKTFTGLRRQGNTTTRFAQLLGPQLDPQVQAAGVSIGGDSQDIVLPRSPKELFDGDFAIEFLWMNRTDPDDPSFVNSELQKFSQGAQSLETTLENLGVSAPEDEIKRIEDEADRFPWIRDGVIKMLQIQLANSGQGQGGGNPDQLSGDPGKAADMFAQKDGSALNVDATAAALPNKGLAGSQYGGA